jgi:DNA-binding NarL/FixJ family response regulator
MKPEKQKPSPGRPRPATPTRARLLLCDDSELMRQSVREFLQGVGHFEVVGEAHGGRPAVTMARELKPDVVLMDVSMPDLDGIEATRQILAHSPDIRVLAFSAESSPNQITKMVAAGAHGYLLKSADPEDLVVALNKVLAGERFVGSPTDDTVNQREPELE